MLNNTKDLTDLNHAVEVTLFTSLGTVTAILNIIIFLSHFDIKDRKIPTTITLHLTLSNMLADVFLAPLHGQGDKWLLRKNLCSSFLVIYTFWRTLSIGFTAFLTVESYIQISRHYTLLNVISNDEVRLESQSYQNTDQHATNRPRSKDVRIQKSIEETVDNTLCLHTKLILLLVWSFGGAVAFLTFVAISISKDCLCMLYLHMRNEFVYLFLVFILVLPSIVMIYINVKFWHMTTKYKRTIASTDSGTQIQAKNLLQDLAYAGCSLRLSQVLILSWLPYIVYTFLIIGWEIKVENFEETAYKAVKTFQWCSYLSTFLQAIVIILKNSQIRTILSNEIKGMCQKNADENSKADPERIDLPLSPSPGLRHKYLQRHLSEEDKKRAHARCSSDYPDTSSSSLHTDETPAVSHLSLDEEHNPNPPRSASNKRTIP